MRYFPFQIAREVSMVLFNHATREMTAKIVYYGPGLCGKTTNLMVIFDKLDPKQKGKMLSLATKTDRTLFFDLLPVDIGKVGAFNLKIQLYTVPGQVFYNETRKLVLKGADAVVFVADSQPSMVESNRESFANLMENLEENNLDVNDTPIVIQFNKRDIPGVLPIETLQEDLGFEGYPYAEAAAIKGEGVMETFKLVSKITAKHLYARLKGKSEPIERKKPAADAPKPAVAAKAAAAPAAAAPEPASQPEVNPFADSVPFPESGPVNQDYEKMEEVSLEQLLSEGRERPATMSGSIPIPVPLPDMSEEVEELGADSMMPMEDPVDVAVPVAVAMMDEPEPAPTTAADDGRAAELEARVRSLESELESARRQHREQLESLAASLGELSRKVLSGD
jgi:signal recognition particle receptor subunit beta